MPADKDNNREIHAPLLAYPINGPGMFIIAEPVMKEKNMTDICPELICSLAFISCTPTVADFDWLRGNL